MAVNPSYDLASRDYENIKRDLLARAGRSIPEWTVRDPGDFTMMLIELWSYMGDVLHYYVDRAAGEAFLSTATQRESVTALANLFDYTPRYKTAAKGTVYITNTASASVELPTETVFSGTYNSRLLFFHSTSSYILDAGESIQVNVQEGSVVTEEVLTSGANGQVGQKYTLSNTEAIPESVRVFVYEDGVTPTEWTKVSNINTVGSTFAGFSVYVNASGDIQVAFGNRLSGRIPPVGAKVTATYEVCSGVLGNIPENKVNSFTTTAPEGLLITGSSSFSFGTDGESIDSIKNSLRALTRTQERAVTLQDFADYASLQASVYKAVASYNGSTKTVTIHTIPYISEYSAYTGASVTATAATKTAVEELITPRMLLGVSLNVADNVELVTANVTATIYVKPTYVATFVKTAVENALDGLFSLNNLDFGKEIPIGQIYRTAMGVEGVDYLTIGSYVLQDSVGGTVSTGTLSPIQFLKKGAFTLTTSGGVTTSI